jgi:hydroxylamine reductase
MKITKKTKLSKVLEENPKAAQALMEAGMHCVGCPMAMQETLEMGCMAHGMEEKDIEELIEKLNEEEQ